MNTLRIIGAGTVGVLHFTQEALEHFKTSNKILWLGTIEGLPDLIHENHWKGEDLTPLYENGALDTTNYDRIKKKVLEELIQNKDVSLVVLGHPRLGVTIVQEFQQEANNHKFNLVVASGISSFDSMINDLELDPIEQGTCLLDANRLLLYDYQMDPCLNYFIYHICSIGNSNTDYEKPSEKNAISFLKDKLLKHFPNNHEIILLTSRTSSTSVSTALKGTIGKLEELLRNVSFSSSLYIAHVLPKANQVNREFLDLICKPALEVQSV